MSKAFNPACTGQLIKNPDAGTPPQTKSRVLRVWDRQTHFLSSPNDSNGQPELQTDVCKAFETVGGQAQ